MIKTSQITEEMVDYSKPENALPKKERQAISQSPDQKQPFAYDKWKQEVDKVFLKKESKAAQVQPQVQPGYPS